MNKIGESVDISKIKKTVEYLEGYGSLVYFGGLIILAVLTSSLYFSVLDPVEIICLTTAGCISIIMGGWIYVNHKRINGDILKFHSKERANETDTHSKERINEISNMERLP